MVKLKKYMVPLEFLSFHLICDLVHTKEKCVKFCVRLGVHGACVT